MYCTHVHYVTVHVLHIVYMCIYSEWEIEWHMYYTQVREVCIIYYSCACIQYYNIMYIHLYIYALQLHVCVHSLCMYDSWPR